MKINKNITRHLQKLIQLLVLGLSFLLLSLNCTTEQNKPLAFVDADVPEVRLDLEDNGGLYLPKGFKATAVVNRLKGKVRHLAVNANGDIYVKLRHPDEAGGNAVLRDTNGDSKADLIKRFGNYPVHGNYGTGMRIHNGYLYYSSQTTVYRQKLTAGKMIPESEVETIVVDDYPKTSREHIAKPIAFDKQGNIYVPFGAPSNACQEPKRTPGAPGQDPCPQLERFGGVWKFDANKKNQLHKDGEKFATGIRSLVCLEWNDADGELYSVMHGRDDLLRMFPQIFSGWDSALLPSEEFIRITKDSDFGWPYCYYDQMAEQKVLAPEYGGDGKIIGRCEEMDKPIMGFPGHWAPNDLLFYRGEQFPERYKKGAFIAFHGSTNRAPYPQSGYIIAFIPFANGNPMGTFEIFADGFARVDTIVEVKDAIFRPMGLAEGPNGELYISETEQGAIWKVEFDGEKETFGESQLAEMEARKQLNHIRTPHIENDNLQKEIKGQGELVYTTYCGTCHQKSGEGDGARFPTLAQTDWVTGDKTRLINILLKGMEGEITVNGTSFNNVMPQHSFLSDEQISEVLTYIRSSFGNEADGVSVVEVANVRAGTL